MKILIASTPANGHVNPMLAITRILLAEGHEVAFYTGAAFRARIVEAGARFFSLPPDADLDPKDPFSRAPELKLLPPGYDWLRTALERLFIDNIAPQYEGVQRLQRSFNPEIIRSSSATTCSSACSRCCSGRRRRGPL
jgi:hypothetical protein